MGLSVVTLACRRPDEIRPPVLASTTIPTSPEVDKEIAGTFVPLVSAFVGDSGNSGGSIRVVVRRIR